ncbi:MAG: hypothetical protein RL616_539 [Verrucomicrobiota bacterium]
MTSRPKHFYALDNLRGLAALLVVIYHWGNFLYDGRSPFHGDPHQLPFYTILRPVYEQGLMAVDLFFCLSGFIFFWLYAQAIAEKKVTFKQFASLRFSRLYPLHFVTLLAAAGATYAIRHLDGSYWGDAGYNDWYHFALQIFFASNWGWEDGVSFNSPIWSVSVEVWLYLMFFSLCRLRLLDWKLVLGYGLTGLLLMQNDSWLVGKGILGFFMGGLAFKFFSQIQTRDIPVRNIVLALGVIWIFFPVNYSMNFAYRAWCHLGAAPDNFVIGQTIILLTTYSYDLFLFPATLVLLALWETKRGTLGRRLAFLGNISYSSYLLHFPLQLLVIILAIRCGWPKSLFTNPAALLVFLGLVIGVSLASYHWFEKPLQHWLRKKMLSDDRPR